MRTVIIQGGMGNQIFQYVFAQYLKQTIDEDIRFYFRKYGSHYGFELPKWFDINIKPAPFYVSLYIKIVDKIHSVGLIKSKGFVNDSNFGLSRSSIYDGYFADKKFQKYGLISFKSDLYLNEKNRRILRLMEKQHYASIHVRRGDYLKPENRMVFCDLCNSHYYQNAVSYVRKLDPECRFIIFSDDIEWCKAHLGIENPIYINWNRGPDSPLDMFLMGKSTYNIIANSTFSYWGALLNRRALSVLYPENWVYPQYPEPYIFPDEWVVISCSNL